MTKPALVQLSRRLARKKADGDMALRFTRREGGWRLRLDRESPGDTSFSNDGRKVLLLDEAAVKAMAHLTLDAIQGEDRSRLKLYRTRPRGD